MSSHLSLNILYHYHSEISTHTASLPFRDLYKTPFSELSSSPATNGVFKMKKLRTWGFLLRQTDQLEAKETAFF